MNKVSLIVIALILTLLGLIYHQEDNIDLSYTQLNSQNNFFEEDMIIKTTKGSVLSNNYFEDKISLIFFGYVNCPDFCPDTLTRMNILFKQIDEDGTNASVQLLFVSVDIENDSSDVIKKYLEYFNDDFIGLSMSEPTLERLTKSIGVYYKKIPTEGEIDFYDHTGSIFILNKQGQLAGLYSPPFDIKLIRDDMSTLVKRNN